MTKVIDIQQLKSDIIAACDKGNVQIPDSIMDDIIQMHSEPTLAYNQLTFDIKLFNGTIDYVVKFDKMLKRTSIVGTTANNNSPVVYGLIEHKFIEKETIMTEQHKETIVDRVKKTYKHVRFNALLKRLNTAATPMEAYQLFIQYMEEDTEISGTLKRKETTIKYRFNYDKETRSTEMKLAIFNVDNQEMPIANIELNLDDKNIETFYHSIISLMNLAK